MTKPELKFGTLDEMIAEQGDNKSEKTFLIDSESGDKYTYSEIDEASSEVANKLSELDIQPGDKVSTIIENSPELVIAICGIQKQGAVAVPVNHEYTVREVSYILGESDSKLAITKESMSQRVKEAANNVGVGDIVYADKDADEYYRSNSGRSTGVNVTPTDTAVLMFTSGTTGDPKGVALSHINLITRFAGGSLSTDESYIFYTILPLYNVDGFTTTFATMYRGQQNVIKDGFSASGFWKDVQDYQTNITSVVPSILAILMERGRPDQMDISSFETFFVSGSYVHDELIAGFEDMFDIDVMEIYGLTEASGTAFKSVDERKISSCGYENRYSELAVLDEETGERLSADRRGEIVIRGPTVFKEYYNNVDATEEVLKGGWFYTGDIGYVDKEGCYYILDRKKNIIIRGGQNIYPGEIEEVLHTYPSVDDVAVVGESDEIYGEIIKSYISTQNIKSEADTISELKSLSKNDLSEYKIPDEFIIVESFPRGETGKILKERLD